MSLPKALLALLAVLLVAALLGVTVQECAAIKSRCACCPPSPGCLALNLDQAPASSPDAPPAAPAAKLFLLAVLAFAAVPIRGSLSIRPLPTFRSDPGRWHAPSRALLSSWTL